MLLRPAHEPSMPQNMSAQRPGRGSRSPSEDLSVPSTFQLQEEGVIFYGQALPA